MGLKGALNWFLIRPPGHKMIYDKTCRPDNNHITLRKLDFLFLPNLMGYDRGDSFPIDFEPNGFPLGSKAKSKNITTIISHCKTALFHDTIKRVMPVPACICNVTPEPAAWNIYHTVHYSCVFRPPRILQGIIEEFLCWGQCKVILMSLHEHENINEHIKTGMICMI